MPRLRTEWFPEQPEWSEDYQRQLNRSSDQLISQSDNELNAKNKQPVLDH